ncbi:hypothetical protein FB567DRAFT_515245 [Paraphoma chrysanthemicola]|uniref:Protein kinase domain-containing protein n=1 Tax=Paraphoma chrysanthemicola TaxID=798071 RepID=A0A8K0W332_9PLEO|nr:hypothetical protein FB567DRAFT_515245 [Paraphoma chrysanthemicola]
MYLDEPKGKQQVMPQQETRGDIWAPNVSDTAFASHDPQPVLGHHFAAHASSSQPLESQPCVDPLEHDGLEQQRLHSRPQYLPASPANSEPFSPIIAKNQQLDSGRVTNRGTNPSNANNSSQVTQNEPGGTLIVRPLLKPRLRSQELLQNLLATFQGSKDKPSLTDAGSRQSWPRRLRFKKHPGSLRERLRAACEDSACEDSYMPEGRFIPASKLRKLVTHGSITEVLHTGTHDPLAIFPLRKKVKSICLEVKDHQKGISRLRTRSSSSLLRDRIEKAYRKVFAILVLVDRPTDIFDFVKEGICDANLPLHYTPRMESNNYCYSFTSKPATETPAWFQEWPLSVKRDFEVQQWLVLAPCFTDSMVKAQHFPFHRQAILPFVAWEKAAKQPGACGQVYKAMIHQDHHAFDDRVVPDGVVAVKKLALRDGDRYRNKITFEHEANILRSISRKDHLSNHLIQLLATFELSGQYYLIFPWAECDLEEFWEHVTPRPDLANWILTQCKGLAEALSTIHHYDTSTGTIIPHAPLIPPDRQGLDRTDSVHISLLGRHGDIKPNNILWFRREGRHGILKITDFGLADFTTENGARRKVNGYVPNTLTYRSPECDLPDGEISSQCDVWALGCVYLIFICWYFGGWSGVTRFQESRLMTDEYWHGTKTDSFFMIIRKEGKAPKAKVKPVVTQVIYEFGSRRDCPSAFGLLLDTIETKMLVVQKKANTQPAQSTLIVPNSRYARRASSGTIHHNVGDILNTCSQTTNRSRYSKLLMPP